MAKAEICIGSYEDAMTAWQNGAERIEFNSALALGGFSPAASDVKALKEKTGLEIICMIRVREGGFCASPLEKESMFAQAKELLEAGADGLAFGFLLSDGSIDIQATRKMADLIHRYGRQAVFHRAIDVSKNPVEAVEVLKGCGIDRILTSGGAATAMEGRSMLAQMQKAAAGDIEILAGSGVNADNVAVLAKETGIDQFHSSCRGQKVDPTTSTAAVSFACRKDGSIDCADPEKIRDFIQSVLRLHV